VTVFPKILFVLPSKGGGGGPNSVFQEACGLHDLGCSVSIAINGKNVDLFRQNYPEAERYPRLTIVGYPDRIGLADIASGYDVICATTNDSVYDAKGVKDVLGDSIKYAYYVQDYEPLFYAYGSEQWKRCFDSYELIPGCQMFAKTDWICQAVYENHGIRPARVQASIDHDVYNYKHEDQALKPTLAAMVRPQTPRRAAQRTIRVLQELSTLFSTQIDGYIFGATDEMLAKAGLAAPASFTNLGLLKRSGVADVLRKSTLFLDLSDYQAFGRTALEAMASGCVPIVPKLGGTDEFAIHGKNAFVVDTRDETDILDAARTFLEMSDADRTTMKMEALSTAQRYSVLGAAISELQLFRSLAQR
jgi:glycosyltransferase involved in cell wall biosynthesis